MSNAGRLPVIALVGRPNVGKSTLFNRLTGTRDAIVANEPGLTRDRQYGFARRAGKRFLVVDTGGLTEGAEGLEAIAGEQSRIAVAEADCVLFLVDGRAGRTSDDDLIAEELRRSGKPIFLVVNKCERLEPNQTAAEFLAWGFADWFAVSAAQGQGVAAMTARLMGDSDDANASDDSGNSSAADDDDDAGSASVIDDRSASEYDEDDVEEDDDQSDDFDDLELDDLELDDLERDDLESLEIDDPEYRAGLAIDDSRPRRVVIVGTPNAGKSTLVNQLLGEERVMASEIPGTTRDSIDVPFRYGEQDYVLVDTAGIRRRAKVQETIEKFSVIKAMQAIELADVVVVLLDAERGLTTQDERVLGLVAERGRACVIAINKWDLVSRAKAAEMRADFAHALKYLDFIRIRTLSAKKGHGIRDLFNSVTEAWEAAHAKLPTPVLSRLLEKAVTQNPPPAVHGRRIKLRYAHQGGMNPVRIIVHGNQASEVPPNYRRYLVKQFREHFRLYGAPIEIELRTGDNPYKHKRNVLTPRQLRKRKRVRGR